MSSLLPVERRGSMNDIPPPPAYEIAVTQPTPVEEERPSTSTGIERERPPPRTPPMTQSNAPPIKDQPVRIEYHHPLADIQNDSSRNTSNRTLPGSNAGHTGATQSAPTPQEQQEEGGQLAPMGRGGTMPPVQPKPKGCVINCFCCCSRTGASSGQYKRFSILWLPTHFFARPIMVSLLKEPTNSAGWLLPRRLSRLDAIE